MKKQNIVLLGFMASGKSKLAKRLAQRLKWQYVDLDYLIEQEAAKSINRIFEEDGEATFRALETEIVSRLSEEKYQVIALGGGAYCNAENIETINHFGTTIFLNVERSVLLGRLKQNRTNRPLVKHLSDQELKDYIAEQLKERLPFYYKADYTLTTNNPTVEDVFSLLNLPEKSG